ncbi:MAG: GNAT family N-acetyltransferase [Alphaproteobacteria bacterium]
MDTKITYTLFDNGLGFNAECGGIHIGEITFVRIGGNKLLIDHTAVESQYRNLSIGFNLVKQVVEFARSKHWYVISICPFARAMFNRYSEFDDVRLINVR